MSEAEQFDNTVGRLADVLGGDSTPEASSDASSDSVVEIQEDEVDLLREPPPPDMANVTLTAVADKGRANITNGAGDVDADKEQFIKSLVEAATVAAQEEAQAVMSTAVPATPSQGPSTPMPSPLATRGLRDLLVRRPLHLHAVSPLAAKELRDRYPRQPLARSSLAHDGGGGFPLLGVGRCGVRRNRRSSAPGSALWRRLLPFSTSSPNEASLEEEEEPPTLSTIESPVKHKMDFQHEFDDEEEEEDEDDLQPSGRVTVHHRRHRKTPLPPARQRARTTRPETEGEKEVEECKADEGHVCLTIALVFLLGLLLAAFFSDVLSGFGP